MHKKSKSNSEILIPELEQNLLNFEVRIYCRVYTSFLKIIVYQELVNLTFLWHGIYYCA